MRHRIRGRKLNRNASHRRAMARNMICSLIDQFGTEREFILTTRAKAKEHRSFAEKLITLGKKGLKAFSAAAAKAGMTEEELQLALLRVRSVPQDEMDRHLSLKGKIASLGADDRTSVQESVASALHYRRLVASRLNDDGAAKKLFEEIAPRYRERSGGYTRVLKTSLRRLGDATLKSMLAFTPA